MQVFFEAPLAEFMLNGVARGSMYLHATQQNRNPFRESNLAELVSNLSPNQMEMFYIFKIDRRDSLVKSCRF